MYVTQNRVACYIQGILALCEFHYCDIHYCNFNYCDFHYCTFYSFDNHKRKLGAICFNRQIVPKLTVPQFLTITMSSSEIHTTIWQVFFSFFCSMFCFSNSSNSLHIYKYVKPIQHAQFQVSCIWWSCISRPYCISGCCQIACCCLDKSPRPQFWEWL